MAAQAEQAKLKKRLEALLKLPENQICADCKKRGPRWASANLGVFFCIECSGIHRNLGVHISFVRSVNLDTWTKQQVDFLEEWGNARANEYYEANIPPNVYRPKEGDSVRVIEKFIRDKYEHKRYIAKTIPPKREAVSTEEDEDDAPRRRGTLSAKKTGTPAAVSRPVVTPSPAIKPVSAPAPAPAEAPSLIDFMDDPVPPPAPAAPVSAPIAAPSPQSTAFGNDWGNFAAAPPAAPANGGFGFESASQPQPQFPSPSQPQSSTDMFSAFASAPATAPAAPAQPPKQHASADAILSLYGGPPQQPGYGQPQGWGGHQQPMNNMNGMHNGFQQPMHPQPMMGGYPQHQQGMGMGHPQQSNMGMPMGHGHPQQFNGGYGQPAMGMQGAGFQQMGQLHQQPTQMYGQYPPQQQYSQQQPPTNPFGHLGNPQQQYPSPTGYPPLNPFQTQNQTQQPQATSASQYPFPNGFGPR